MTVNAETRAVLANRSSPLAQIVKAVGAAEAALGDAPETTIGVSAAITADLLGLFLRRESALNGLRARIVNGGYDDPIGDMDHFAREGVERVVLLPFFDNILPSFEAQIGSTSDELLDSKEAELRARFRIIFDRAKAFKAVHVILYHRLGASPNSDGRDPVADAVARFNSMLAEEASAFRNIQLIDAAETIARIGRDTAFDRRFYFRSKAPYSPALMSALAERIALASRHFGTRFYKALALDCDNTLWGGIIGEDLIEGIRLDPFDYPGNIFWQAQHVFSALEKQGILLCLCTKNNPVDVEEVFRDHPNMILKEEQIAARRVNWDDKVANLQALANELNIGLDSMIFLDDSPVEAESVRGRLPMVTMVEVPASLPDYPKALDEIAGLFLGGGAAIEGGSKTEHYRIRAAAAAAQTSFATHEDYLASLELEIELHVDDRKDSGRVSELSQKSNQFNMTTRRLSEAEVLALMGGDDTEVVTVRVRNKFGDSGMTGILLLHFDREIARVDNFLMSCRVLGQGIEFALWTFVLDRCRARSCTRLEAEFRSTAKNAQARDFFDRLGLLLVGDDAKSRRYSQPLAAFEAPYSPWIKVSHV